MKKNLMIILIFLSLFYLYAKPQTALGIDTFCVQDLMKKKDMQFNADFRMKLDEGFEIRLPVTYSISKENWIADAGLNIICYPFDKGLFFGISAVEFAYKDSSFIAMNEISVGWTFKLFKRLFIEPQIILRDPSGTYSQEYSKIRATFPSYSTFRIRLLTGYKF